MTKIDIPIKKNILDVTEKNSFTTSILLKVSLHVSNKKKKTRKETDKLEMTVKHELKYLEKVQEQILQKSPTSFHTWVPWDLAD